MRRKKGGQGAALVLGKDVCYFLHSLKPGRHRKPHTGVFWGGKECRELLKKGGTATALLHPSGRGSPPLWCEETF